MRSVLHRAAGALLLLLLAPLLVIIGGWVLIESHGPIVVHRAVVGPAGRVIYVTDFRMWRVLDPEDAKVQPNRSAPGRRPDTVIGRVLHATRTSHLPRMFAVTSGRLTLAEAMST